MKAIVVAISAVGLLATGGAALGAEPAPDPDCAKVLKAKAESDVSISTKDLAERLGMPTDKVNACLMKVRSHAPRGTPATKK